VGDEQSEYERHSFVIKIWLEETASGSHQATWRGRVTHVGDEEKRYVKSLHDITSRVICSEWAPRLNDLETRVGARSDPYMVCRGAS
jgi:hypothetical protein